MKKGDIVIMPGQSTSVEPASVGILVSSENDGKHVLVLWNDAEGVAYEEPRAWLAVIGNVAKFGLATPTDWHAY